MKTLCYISILSLVFVFTSGCKKNNTSFGHSFPLPGKTTLVLNDGNEVSFSGEILSFENEEIIEHGFVWHAVDDRLDRIAKDSVIILGSPDGKKIEFSSTSHFGKGFLYEVKIFLKTNKKVVYGIPIEFVSNGTIRNPYQLKFLDLPCDDCANNNKIPINLANSSIGPFILFSELKFYKFNESTSILEPKKNYPKIYEIDPVEDIDVAKFYTSDKLYFWNTKKNTIYNYDQNNNAWNVTGITGMNNNPILANPKFEAKGFSYNGNGYFIDKGFFAKNPLDVNEWEALSPIPSDQLVKSVIVDNIRNLAIAITSDGNIWTYDLQNEGEWDLHMETPFDVGNILLSYILNNRLIIGPSLPQNEFTASSFWEFNIDINEWKEIPNFPLHIDNEPSITSCQSNQYGYFSSLKQFTNFDKKEVALWVIDESKL